MTDSFKLQISVKIPHDNDNYRDTMVNLRADTSGELDALLAYVQDKGAEIASAVTTLRAGANVGQAFAGPGTQAVPTEQGWAQQPPPAAGPPQWAPQQQAAPTAGPPAPQCAHGAMTHRSGNKNGREWNAYFCPTPKGTPGQCDPQWVK